jgi:hypothetical protein
LYVSGVIPSKLNNFAVRIDRRDILLLRNPFLDAKSSLHRQTLLRLIFAVLELLKLAVFIHQEAHIPLLDSDKTGDFVPDLLPFAFDVFDLTVHHS